MSLRDPFAPQKRAKVLKKYELNKKILIIVTIFLYFNRNNVLFFSLANKKTENDKSYSEPFSEGQMFAEKEEHP